MGTQNPIAVKGLSVEERKARLAALVASGVVTAEQAGLIDLERVPSDAVGERARVLEGSGMMREMRALDLGIVR